MKAGEFKGEQHEGTRMLLLQSGASRICLPLDQIVELVEETEDSAGLRPSYDVVSWAGLTGETPESNEHTIVVVDSSTGHIGLRVGACLGIRHICPDPTKTFDTRIVDETGRSLCSVLLLDGYPHFLIEPAALVHARSANAIVTDAMDSASPGLPGEAS